LSFQHNCAWVDESEFLGKGGNLHVAVQKKIELMDEITSHFALSVVIRLA